MGTLLNNFKSSIFAAVNHYENSKNKKIPTHRQKNIQRIKTILNNKNHGAGDIEQINFYKSQILKETSKFYTGFLFWRTGNSQLKNQLNQALKPYLNSQLLEIQAQVSEAQTPMAGMRKS